MHDGPHPSTAPEAGAGAACWAGPRRVDRLLAHYAQSHQHPVNERIHLLAIPAIMLSLVGLLFALHPWVAYGFVGLSLLYYLMLGAPLFLAVMVLWTALLLLAVHALGPWVLPVSALLFVVAWIFQFIGHRIEGRKPSFFEDLQYLYVGPLFVAALGLQKLGLRG